MNQFEQLINDLKTFSSIEKMGEIKKFTGLLIEATDPSQLAVGDICDILSPESEVLMKGQVVGFNQKSIFIMPFGTMLRISRDCKIRQNTAGLTLPLSREALGRALNAFGEPIDNRGALFTKRSPQSLNPVNPLERQLIHERFFTGIHCIDQLLPLGRGQRMGIFAGSGVGKSMLLSKIAKNTQSDVNVIALIGERGREVNEFISMTLNPDALSKSVIIAATADESALMRKQAVFTAITFARHFCEQGLHVVLMLDSITRFAMALREIGLSLGEPPTARGYTPSVFSLLPKIVEQSGHFNKGSITAFYTVLVEGDDFNEPIADTLRSLLDGHLILTRALAEKGHYPAIDVLQSISRLSTQICTEDEALLIKSIKNMLSLYEQSKDLIAVGAYQSGRNLELDKAVQSIDKINALLIENSHNNMSYHDMKNAFKKILGSSNET